MLYHYYYLKYLQPLKTINIQEWEIYIWTVQFLWTFHKIDRFVIGPFEKCLWTRHLYLLKNKEFTRAWYHIFIPGWKKCRLYGKFGISIQGLNHNSGWLDRVEISTQNTELAFLHTCNCTVILKRSLPLSRDKISIGSNELKFQPGLTISI